MEDPKNKYILLQDRVGFTLERNLLALGLSPKSTPIQVLRGELLEALPEAEQPSDSTRIALVGIDRKSLRLECRREDLNRLSDEDANLLLAIDSTELRYRTFFDTKRLEFGRRLSPQSEVSVSLTGISKGLRGILWYKGELPSKPGTVFGVELIDNQGQGTTDGTFRNKRYFTCPPDSGVFVGLDKLTPREDPDSHSPPNSQKRDAQANFKSRLKETVLPSFFMGKHERKWLQERTDSKLKIDQRVVTFIGDYPARGTVRYIGQEKDSSGNLRTIVGLEMDERVGSGNGKRNGRQLFVCKRDFAEFVLLETVIPEEDFDENPTKENSAGKETFHKEHIVQKQIRSDEFHPKSISYDYRTAGGESVTRARRTNSFEAIDVIKAAGELSKTDTSSFIEQQRRLLDEFESAKSTPGGNRENDDDVDRQNEDLTCDLIDFQDEHFRKTPPNVTISDNKPDTKGIYPDYVYIEEDDYEKLIGKHEGSRHVVSEEFATSATQSNRCSDEVLHPQQGLDGTPSLAVEVVSDWSPRTNEEMDDAFKEPSEQREMQMAFLQSGDLAADRKTGNGPSENSQRQLNEMEQHLTNVQGQLREKEANLQVQLREKTQQEENFQRQLREMEQQVTRMQKQLREKDLELENSERLSRDREQQLTDFQRQLGEKELQEARLHEQLRENGRQEENLQRQLRELEQQVRERDGRHEETLQRQLRELEQQGVRTEQDLREKEEQKENLQRQLRELEQQLTNLQSHLIDQEQETAYLQQQVSTLEEQLRAKDQDVNELEITLSTARQALSENRRQQSPDWVIFRDQIQLTDKFLGRGGWGSVVEGKYCGCAVAVKQIHELILSPHNRILFEREMDIAAKCRHPCLLQFIGATNDEGSPLFLTELMESSLRALLERRPLAATEVSIISLDVARALSYLHQKTPSPIIHRDISSANVLLWRQGDQWRGKVSDYGTANFMQHTMTVAPGATIYIAPEALTSNQTVKVDVYSFGVLLCEMCIRELPDPERRDQQIVMVESRLLRALIRGCVQTEPGSRPNMEEIIEELEEPV